jgi:hypothetical protein
MMAATISWDDLPRFEQRLVIKLFGGTTRNELPAVGVDESIARYLSQLDSADRQGESVPEAGWRCPHSTCSISSNAEVPHHRA